MGEIVEAASFLVILLLPLAVGVGVIFLFIKWIRSKRCHGQGEKGSHKQVKKDTPVTGATTYRLQSRFGGYPNLILLTLAGLWIPVAEADIGDGMPGWLFFVIWYGFLAWFWRHWLTQTRSVIRHSDGRLEFKSTLKSRSVVISELQSIERPNKLWGLPTGNYRFVWLGGDAEVHALDECIEDLIAEIEAINSNARIH